MVRHACALPGPALEIRDVSGRVANAFAVDGPSVVVDQFFNGGGVVTCREARINAALSKDVLKQSVSGAVELGQGNDVISISAMLMIEYSIAAIPELTLSAATPPSRAATRFSRTRR